jgi:hypothetical protein
VREDVRNVATDVIRLFESDARSARSEQLLLFGARKLSNNGLVKGGGWLEGERIHEHRGCGRHDGLSVGLAASKLGYVCKKVREIVSGGLTVLVAQYANGSCCLVRLATDIFRVLKLKSG